jgi:hypothetical protein
MEVRVSVRRFVVHSGADGGRVRRDRDQEVKEREGVVGNGEGEFDSRVKIRNKVDELTENSLRKCSHAKAVVYKATVQVGPHTCILLVNLFF